MNTDKLKQMYASGVLLRAILKDPKMRQMASDMLASGGQYPLAPWMKDYNGNVDAEAQRAAEMPSLSETMGLGVLPAQTILRGEAVDAEGVSMNDKYARQQANQHVNFESGGVMSAVEPPKYAGKKEWAMSPAAVPFVAAEMERRGIGFPSDMVQSTFQGILSNNPEIGSEIIDYAFMRAADESRQRGSTDTFGGSYDKDVISRTVPGYRTTATKPSGYRD